MAKRRGDSETLDILEDWTPPEVVKRYDDTRVRTASLRAKVARAVSETLRECNMRREDIAAAMSEWLGEEVTKNMLDAYSSEAREEHTIPYLRLLALIEVTDDVRLLQVGAEMFDHVVADNKYLEWIRVGMEADRRDHAKKVQEDCDREFDIALRAARKRGV
jgi:desulfoferrodoxin (superoxide reductase-like protein)